MGPRSCYDTLAQAISSLRKKLLLIRYLRYSCMLHLQCIVTLCCVELLHCVMQQCGLHGLDIGMLAQQAIHSAQ
jgi:hypothetical protein